MIITSFDLYEKNKEYFLLFCKLLFTDYRGYYEKNIYQ